MYFVCIYVCACIHILQLSLPTVMKQQSSDAAVIGWIEGKSHVYGGPLASLGNSQSDR